MSDQNVVVKTGSGGVGVLGLLTLVFVIAKIGEFEPCVNWSWWLVFFPLWGPSAFVLGVLFLALVIFCVGVLIVFLVKFIIGLCKTKDRSVLPNRR